MGKEGERELFVGVDESNHGRYPEIYVAVFSTIHTDAVIYPSVRFHKNRRYHTTIKDELEKRDYSFLVFNKEDKDFARDDRFLGVVVASLIIGQQPIVQSSAVKFYIDGKISARKYNPIEEIIRRATGIGIIEINCGKDYDRRVQIVNLADETAHLLYKKTLEKIASHPKKKVLRRDLLDI